MIPTEEYCKVLWDKYGLPEGKRGHVALVARVARFLAEHIDKVTKQQMNKPLLHAGALLHDIDKNIPRLPGEMHPDTAVRILTEEGMGEVAALVKTHPLHAILNPAIAPRTIEEKLLYLSDKMVKHEVIGVDARFKLWNDEHLPKDQQAILRAAYPKVKALEKELLGLMGIESEELIRTLKERKSV